jgi:integrase
MFSRRGERKYLTEAERWAFFETVEEQRESPYRLFTHTLFYTGARISEALRLTCNQVDVANQTLIFETLKRHKRGCYRSVPIPLALAEFLAVEIKGREQSTAPVWTFCRSTGYRQIKKLMTQTGIEGVRASPKALRHSFATGCIAKGAPLPLVQEWLGHANLKTTAIYLDFQDKEERSYAKRTWKKSPKLVS